VKLKIPFTKYEVSISKRGLSYIDPQGQLVGFSTWMGESVFTPTTPIIEEVYSTIANEFAKIDLLHIIDRDGEYKRVNDNLNYILSERPNMYQSSFDFKFTMMYQLLKYGNAMAFIHRDSKGRAISIDPINVLDYQFGGGYLIEEELVMFKLKNNKTQNIELVPYQNMIHLRLNPNNIFYGDLFSGISFTKVFTDLIDASLGSSLRELQDNGSVRGVITIGKSAQGFANATMANDQSKVKKQQEIIDRIKASKGGILVLDAGEEWQSLSSPFSTSSSDDIDKYISMLLQFNGINKKVVDGTATEEEMEVFYAKTVMPRIEQFISELNYKIFNKTSITQGHRIEFFKNPFEYVSTAKAVDIAYKASMDTTTNERRKMIYKLPPVENGDILMVNRNFEPLTMDVTEGELITVNKTEEISDEQNQ
jgi:HK97 family phage portal protein